MLCGVIFILFLLTIPCSAQVIDLGINEDTGLREIRVELPGLPEGATPIEMVLIPAGTFMMGAPRDERGLDGDEMPQHQVTITQPYYLGKYVITQAQWELMMGENPSYYGGHPNHPVESFTWNNCKAFIESLNGLELGTFRLPTEAEWEYACRAGTTTRFSFGDALECSDEDEFCELADQYMWWGGNDEIGGNAEAPREVGLKLPNPWGLYDMHGNVLQLCQDWYGYYTRGSQVDPQGPETGTLHAARGGFYDFSFKYCRSATHHVMHNSGYYHYGVRLVRLYTPTSQTENWAEYK